MPTRPHSGPMLYDGLFGEVGDLPDVIHCESIRARSRLHDWELVPHRHGRLHQLLLIESGGGEAVLDGERQPLADMQLINVPAGLIHGFSFTPGTRGWVVTLASEMVLEALGHSEGLRHVLGAPGLVPADPPVLAVVEQIFAEYQGREFARAQLLRSLTGLLLGSAARSLVHDGNVPATAATDDRFQRFEDLLESHYVDHWSVADYASSIGVSPTHLSRLTRTATGMPASRLIDDRIVREARRHLAYTNLAVATIAESLGFADPAYFSRVFARVTGMSPRAFRDRLEEGA